MKLSELPLNKPALYEYGFEVAKVEKTCYSENKQAVFLVVNLGGRTGETRRYWEITRLLDESYKFIDTL